MPETVTSTLAERLQDVIAKLDAPFPGPAGGWSVEVDEHDRSNHALLVAGPERGEKLKINVRLDGYSRRLVVSFYAHRHYTDAVGRHSSIYAKDLFRLSEWETFTTNATVAPDANATRIATAIRKVLPAALKAHEALEDWSWNTALRASKRDRVTAAVRTATGANLTPHASREETSAYLPAGPLKALLGEYAQVVVDASGNVTLTGVRLDGDRIEDVLAALSAAAATYNTARG